MSMKVIDILKSVMPAESITLNTYQHTRLSGTDNSQNEINKDKLFLKYRITFKLKNIYSNKLT